MINSNVQNKQFWMIIVFESESEWAYTLEIIHECKPEKKSWDQGSFM